MDDEQEADEYHAVLEAGGQAYWLVAVRTYGGYHAAWGCSCCNEARYCGHYNEANEGMQQAKECALAHHAQLHSAAHGKPR